MYVYAQICAMGSRPLKRFSKLSSATRALAEMAQCPAPYTVFPEDSSQGRTNQTSHMVLHMRKCRCAPLFFWLEKGSSACVWSFYVPRSWSYEPGWLAAGTDFQEQTLASPNSTCWSTMSPIAVQLKFPLIQVLFTYAEFKFHIRCGPFPMMVLGLTSTDIFRECSGQT